MWSTFHLDYIKATFPRLMVRAEDLIFHPRRLIEIIANCSGMSLKHGTFQYVAESTKQATDTTLLSAMMKYGTAEGRFFRPGTITREETQYLQTALNPELMQLFHYPQIPVDTFGSEKDEYLAV